MEFDELSSDLKKFALLIDGDNAPPKITKSVLSEIEKYGNVTIRRVYGDFTTDELKAWEEISKTNAILPVQQYRYTTGKNATDNALTIDAMDILHRNLVEGFCIVSSDSDYTRLVTRIREEGVTVMGIGEKKTPDSLVNAYDKFIYCEILAPDLFKKEAVPKKSVPKKSVPKKSVPKKPAEKKIIVHPLSLIKDAFDSGVSEDGSILLSYLGDLLRRKNPDFDPRNYGKYLLSDLIKVYSQEFELYTPDKKAPQKIYVRRKK